MNQQRLEEFAYLLHESLRHISKHDVLEEANLFEIYDRPAGNPEHWPENDWNNDTVVYALQVICEEWLTAHGFKKPNDVMPYLDYVRLDRGFAPPIEQTLREIEILPNYDKEKVWP